MRIQTAQIMMCLLVYCWVVHWIPGSQRTGVGLAFFFVLSAPTWCPGRYAQQMLSVGGSQPATGSWAAGQCLLLGWASGMSPDSTTSLTTAAHTPQDWRCWLSQNTNEKPSPGESFCLFTAWFPAVFPTLSPSVPPPALYPLPSTLNVSS